MKWPTPQDYNEAIQNAPIAFKDPDLRRGKAKVSRLGIPTPISGSFASVYEIVVDGKRWAVRCFLSHFGDQEQRYEHISRHLKQARLASMVDFQFEREGIKVDGDWYPIVKMEWIDGHTLNEFVERNLRQPLMLEQLALQWISLLAELRNAGIAHGDLQHGNVLVSEGRIRLIDYDGMFVPALRGFSSHECGHRNYQHPRRSEDDFGPTLDGFSGWVICLALESLCIEPRLWTTLNGGDECLLFRDDDYGDIVGSRAHRELLSCGRPELVTLANRLRTLVETHPREIPPVEPMTLRPKRVIPKKIKKEPEWLELPGPKVEPLAPLPKSPLARVDGANWVMDHTIDEIEFADEMSPIPSYVPKLADRFSLIFCGFAATCAIGTAATGHLRTDVAVVLALGAIGSCLATLTWRYRTLPAFGELQMAHSRREKIEQRLRNAESQLTLVRDQCARELGAIGDVVARYAGLPERLRQRRRQLREDYFSARTKSEAKCKAFEEKESKELTEVIKRLSSPQWAVDMLAPAMRSVQVESQRAWWNGTDGKHSLEITSGNDQRRQRAAAAEAELREMQQWADERWSDLICQVNTIDQKLREDEDSLDQQFHEKKSRLQMEYDRRLRAFEARRDHFVAAYTRCGCDVTREQRALDQVTRDVAKLRSFSFLRFVGRVLWVN